MTVFLPFWAEIAVDLAAACAAFAAGFGLGGLRENRRRRAYHAAVEARRSAALEERRSL